MSTLNQDLFNEVKEMVLNAIQSGSVPVPEEKKEEIAGALDSPFDQISDTIKFMLDGLLNLLFPPALLIKNNFLADSGGFLVQALNTHRSRIAAAAQASGRIDIHFDGQIDSAGTAWLVAHDIVATNSHVVKKFSHSVGSSPAFYNGYFGNVMIDFKAEKGSGNDRKKKFVVSDILYKDESKDLAFLRVKKKNAAGQNLPAPLELAQSPMPKQNVCIIGFPKHELNPQYPYIMKRIMPEETGQPAKRITTGNILDVKAEYFTHNCSALTGNSGSVVFDYVSGKAVGLHVSGVYKPGILPVYRGISSFVILKEMKKISA